MARILLAWELGGNRGHVVKLGAVAARLVAEGHAVGFAVQRPDALRALRATAEASEIRQAPLWPGLLLDGRHLSFDAYLDENVALGTSLGTLTVRGRPAGEAPTITEFEVLAFRNSPTFGVDVRNDLFAIGADGGLTVTGPLDFEAYDRFGLRVFYEDALGNAGFDVVSVVLDDLNDAPFIVTAPGLSATPILREHSNLSGDVLLGDISILDQDGAPNGVVFALSGPDAAFFKVVGTQLFLRAGVALAFEEEPALSVTLSVRDRTLAPETAQAVTLNFAIGFAERTGTNGDDTVVTTAGVDVARGLGGADALNGAAGDDVLDGGAGTDLLRGGVGADALDGGAGNDSLKGGTGNDTLEGAYGDDLLVGDDGNDVIHGDLSPAPRAEALRWDGDLAAVPGVISQVTGRVIAAVTIQDDGSLDGASLTDAPQYVEAGEPFATDSGVLLEGGAGPIATLRLAFTEAGQGTDAEVRDVTFRINDVDALSWQDSLTVTAFRADGTVVAVTLRADGNDAVSGGTITGADGEDQPDEIGGSVLVTIEGPVHSVSVAYQNLRSSTQIVTLTDVHFEADPALLPFGGDDALLGGAGDDALSGGLGADTLRGDDGHDTLIGGAGADVSIGGLGADVFRLLAATDSGVAGGTRDTVRDFARGEDVLDWSAIRATGGGELSVQAVAGAAFSGLAGEIRIVANVPGDRVLALADLDGDRDADLAVSVIGTTQLGAGDFLL